MFTIFSFLTSLQGSRILCTLNTHEAVAVHGNRLLPKNTYEVSHFFVAEPGLGIHTRFHLLFDEDTSIKVVSARFVDRVFNLRTPSDLPTCPTFLGNLYGKRFSYSCVWKGCGLWLRRTICSLLLFHSCVWICQTCFSCCALLS